MDGKARVCFADATKSVREAVARVFSAFGGGENLLKSSRDVYLKINAVDSKPFCFTDPEVIAETVRYFKEAGARDVYVIENCTQGNFTRLVFTASGIDAACRDAGAIPVCLDETGQTPVFLPSLARFVNISEFVAERLIRNRAENLYVSLPKLKTHSMSTVTLSVKNQFGFVTHKDRVADHNFQLHRKFADIFSLVRPDFVLVDGLLATNHGHYIAEKNADECIERPKVLFGGPDALAVDVTGSAFMGISLEEVEHLRLCAEMGLGTWDLARIEIEGRELFDSRRMSFTHQLLERFPADLRIVKGKERCCPEGCGRNTETLLEVLHCDHGGKGGFTVLMGKGIPEETVRAIDTPVHLAGSCAISDWGWHFEKEKKKRLVTLSPGCNDLSASIYSLCKQMKVNPLSLSGVGIFTSLGALVSAKARGSSSVIPKLF
ncbi:MAG: DUF362 domain-containing protein [Thermodesulfobacteriota bacterium]